MLPKAIALKIGYDNKPGDKSCLIVIQGDNESGYTVHNVFYGTEANKLIRKLISGGNHENKFA